MAKNHLMEMALSAQANFENFATACPAFARHPYFKIAKMQLDEACDLIMGRTPDPKRWEPEGTDDDPPPRAA